MLPERSRAVMVIRMASWLYPGPGRATVTRPVAGS